LRSHDTCGYKPERRGEGEKRRKREEKKSKENTTRSLNIEIKDLRYELFIIRNLKFIIELRFAWRRNKRRLRFDSLKICLPARVKFIDMLEETKF